jgi:transcriptional regulator with XRE-family HTH domain
VAAKSHRESLRRWMSERGLKPLHVAKKAKIAPGTLYNLLNGDTEKLSLGVIEKIARAYDTTIDEVLGGSSSQLTAHKPLIKTPLLKRVRVTHRVGVGGRMFGESQVYEIAAPAGHSGEDLEAAVIDGDGLRPLPAGWHVHFSRVPADPETLIGELAVVRFAGSSQPLVREIRRGSQAGLYTLLGWNSAPIEDVEITAAHRIEGMTPPVRKPSVPQSQAPAAE